MHFNRFHLSGDHGRGKRANHTWLQNSCLNPSRWGRRRGLEIGLSGGSIASIASMSVFPSTGLGSFPEVSLDHPLYHGIFNDSSTMLSPCQPEIGKMASFLGL